MFREVATGEVKKETPKLNKPNAVLSAMCSRELICFESENKAEGEDRVPKCLIQGSDDGKSRLDTQINRVKLGNAWVFLDRRHHIVKP